MFGGATRLAIVRELGIETVPVLVYDFTDPLEIQQALLIDNLDRVKNNEQNMREFALTMDIETAKATLRMKAGKSISVDPMANLPQGRAMTHGTARDIAANRLGLKPRSAEKGLKALKAADSARQNGYSAESDIIIDALNKSFNAGYKAAIASGFLLENVKPSCFTPLKGIAWARWQWDVITGCPHGCKDCPARAFAQAAPMRFLANKIHFAEQSENRQEIFNVRRHREVMRAPFDTPVSRSDDPAYTRVLTCWYSDILDVGIKPEWRAELLSAIRKCNEEGRPWQFLLRTCQPKRLLEILWPDNVEICISVSRQAQVSDAIEVMMDLHRQQPGISLNLLYDPRERILDFATLKGFHWLYLGSLPGASTCYDACRMTIDEFYALRAQAALAGCRFTRSPGICLATLDELAEWIEEIDAADIIRALYHRMEAWYKR